MRTSQWFCCQDDVEFTLDTAFLCFPQVLWVWGSRARPRPPVGKRKNYILKEATHDETTVIIPSGTIYGTAFATVTTSAAEETQEPITGTYGDLIAGNSDRT